MCSHITSLLLRASSICYSFDNGGPVAGGMVLGDSAYPCLPWLLTPVAAPQAPEEERLAKVKVKIHYS